MPTGGRGEKPLLRPVSISPGFYMFRTLRFKPLQRIGLRHVAAPWKHGQTAPPEPPRRDNCFLSIPPLDFFTPLAPMWFFAVSATTVAVSLLSGPLFPAF